mgnify:CR=1 FL=1
MLVIVLRAQKTLETAVRASDSEVPRWLEGQATLSHSAPLPSAVAAGGYHCWAEFFAEGQWWPIDISEADKYTSLATYYFGHNPANRLELSRGRDLVVEPGPKSGPINFLAYPVLEVNGESIKVKKPKFEVAAEREQGAFIPS